jgi:hypothetical protein
MQPQYTYDKAGNPIGVFLPIEDWNNITERYADIEELPQWQKNIIDQRLQHLQQYPEQVTSLNDFITEFDAEDAL